MPVGCGVLRTPTRYDLDLVQRGHFKKLSDRSSQPHRPFPLLPRFQQRLREEGLDFQGVSLQTTSILSFLYLKTRWSQQGGLLHANKAATEPSILVSLVNLLPLCCPITRTNAARVGAFPRSG